MVVVAVVDVVVVDVVVVVVVVNTVPLDPGIEVETVVLVVVAVVLKVDVDVKNGLTTTKLHKLVGQHVSTCELSLEYTLSFVQLDLQPRIIVVLNPTAMETIDFKF